MKLFQNLTSGFREEDFLRKSLCPYSARSPHSPEPCFGTNQNFADTVWKGLSKEHSYEIISKSVHQFLRRFLNCLKKSIWLPWQPEILMESNSLDIFESDLRRNIPAEFGPILPAFWEEEMFK